jgi:hypothetical protein
VYVCSILKSECHVIWVDNFSKVYQMKIPNMDIGVWHDCLWTGVAIREFVPVEPRYSNLSLAIDMQPGDDSNAMPNDLFHRMKKFLASAKQITDSTMFVYDTSIVTRYNVRNVPLKPIVDAVAHPKWHSALASSVDGLYHLHPVGLIKRNIGSNEGLMRILKRYVDIYEEEKVQLYQVMNVDINIFKRIIKVSFCAFPCSFVISCVCVMCHIVITLHNCCRQCTTQRAVVINFESSCFVTCQSGTHTSMHASLCGSVIPKPG